jgi:hypothetical protein
VKVRAARALTVQWIKKNGPTDPGFGGAFFAGQTTALADDARLPPATPIEVFMVTDARSVKLGTFEYRDVLIDVTYVSWSQLDSADLVLSSYQLAGSLRRGMVIADPTGQLIRLQQQVARRFTRLPWVRQRCENARRRAEESLRAVEGKTQLADQVATWLTGMAATNHILMVADLRLPVVRQSYVDVREILEEYDRAHFYADLLEVLGCVHLTHRRVQYHLLALEHTFDQALANARSPYYLSSHISPESRVIAVDGSHELLDLGYHREAMFWVVMTFAHCHQSLAADAPRRTRAELMPAFEAALNDLGISIEDGVTNRAQDAMRFIPHVWSMAEVVLAHNSAIRSS